MLNFSVRTCPQIPSKFHKDRSQWTQNIFLSSLVGIPGVDFVATLDVLNTVKLEKALYEHRVCSHAGWSWSSQSMPD